MIATNASGTCALIGLLLGTLVVSGCHTHQHVALPGSASAAAPEDELPHVNPGDHVRVTMRTGERLNFLVEEVLKDALIAKGGRRFPYEEMARLEKKQLAKGRTTALVVGISAAALTLILLAATAAALAAGLSEFH
jgi:hypothetical protein